MQIQKRRLKIKKPDFKNQYQFVLIILVLAIFLGAYSLGFADQNRSFRITDYQAQAKILENGDIEVREIFTYDFDGNFNGIIRSIGIQGSDGLAYFKASEYSPQKKALETSQEREGDMVTFRIYDQSANERKSFLLEYQLKNVITKYNDIAELYWKFFGKTNTSSIGQVSVEIIFPNLTVSAPDLKVFGHGPSDGQVAILDNGVVLYEVNGLPSGEMVEARVLFPTDFVPYAGRIVYQDRFDQIMQEELNWAKKSDRENNFIFFALLLIPLIILINIIMAIRFYFKYDRELKPEIKLDYYRELPQDMTPAVMSHLMSVQGAGTKDIMATLMDLARKKYLQIEEIPAGRKKDYRFILLNDHTDALKAHEVELIHWLFYSVGDGESVSLKGIESYAKASLTQGSFRHQYNKWLKTVKKEFKKYQYFGEDKPALRAAFKVVLWEFAVFLLLLVAVLLLGVSWFVLIPLLFVIGSTGIGLIAYGALIRKKTQTGINEYQKWSAFKRFLLHFSNMKDYEIPSVVVWEHYLVYAISLGIAQKVISKLRPVLADQNINIRNSAFLYHMTNRQGQLNASMFGSFDKVFSNAFARASASTGSGGGFSSGGGGGGGGGGAGAF